MDQCQPLNRSLTLRKAASAASTPAARIASSPRPFQVDETLPSHTTRMKALQNSEEGGQHMQIYVHRANEDGCGDVYSSCYLTAAGESRGGSDSTYCIRTIGYICGVLAL